MEISSKEILQIDATIITGILILLTIIPYAQISIVEQSLEGTYGPSQIYDKLRQLNETELDQYTSEFMKEQNELNKSFFSNPLLWATAIGNFFTMSALLALVSLIVKNVDYDKTKKLSLIFMANGFLAFLVMFYTFIIFKFPWNL